MDRFISTYDESGNNIEDVRASEVVSYRHGRHERTNRYGTKVAMNRATLRNGAEVWINCNAEIDEQPTIIPNTTDICALIDFRDEYHQNPTTCPTPYKQVSIIGWRVFHEDSFTSPGFVAQIGC